MPQLRWTEHGSTPPSRLSRGLRFWVSSTSETLHVSLDFNEGGSTCIIVGLTLTDCGVYDTRSTRYDRGARREIFGQVVFILVFVAVVRIFDNADYFLVLILDIGGARKTAKAHPPVDLKALYASCFRAHRRVSSPGQDLHKRIALNGMIVDTNNRMIKGVRVNPRASSCATVLIFSVPSIDAWQEETMVKVKPQGSPLV